MIIHHLLLEDLLINHLPSYYFISIAIIKLIIIIFIEEAEVVIIKNHPLNHLINLHHHFTIIKYCLHHHQVDHLGFDFLIMFIVYFTIMFVVVRFVNFIKFSSKLIQYHPYQVSLTQSLMFLIHQTNLFQFKFLLLHLFLSQSYFLISLLNLFYSYFL